MEQRSDTNVQPVVAGAATDPAQVPGLVNLRAPEAAPEAEESGQEAQAAGPGQPGSTPGAAAAGDGTGPADASRAQGPEAAAGAADEGAGADGEPAAAEDRDGPGADASPGPDGGPSLEAADRRSSIVAGRAGVRFTLDDQEADFRWDEIGAVEVAVPRFGKRLSVVVHTRTHRSYEADAEAPARGVLKEWAERLDAVLDAYFEEDGQDEPGGDAEPEQQKPQQPGEREARQKPEKDSV
ncbi:hypothetical protein AB0910_21465 [Streptomyces sp. NPDC047002]|uniref:hypothetical protein n=1 Tax=Streptomyces sp. NPDC047002 TaxID=3155475 RepID=UPI0034555D67